MICTAPAHAVPLSFGTDRDDRRSRTQQQGSSLPCIAGPTTSSAPPTSAAAACGRSVRPLRAYSGEISVTASLGLGGLGPSRDRYAGVGSGQRRPAHLERWHERAQFAEAGIAGGVRSVAFDPYGLYGNTMIVATNAGNVYTARNAGVATLLAKVGEDAEGLSFVQSRQQRQSGRRLLWVGVPDRYPESRRVAIRSVPHDQRDRPRGFRRSLQRQRVRWVADRYVSRRGPRTESSSPPTSFRTRFASPRRTH